MSKLSDEVARIEKILADQRLEIYKYQYREKLKENATANLENQLKHWEIYAIMLEDSIMRTPSDDMNKLKILVTDERLRRQRGETLQARNTNLVDKNLNPIYENDVLRVVYKHGLNHEYITDAYYVVNLHPATGLQLTFISLHPETLDNQFPTSPHLSIQLGQLGIGRECRLVINQVYSDSSVEMTAREFSEEITSEGSYLNWHKKTLSETGV